MFLIIPAIVIALLTQAATADAASNATFTYNNATISKVEALRTLLRDPNASVQKCQQIVLTDQGTLKTRPAKPDSQRVTAPAQMPTALPQKLSNR